MRTSNRPMTPQAAFTWITEKVTRPQLMTVLMDADNKYVLKIGSAPRTEEAKQANPGSTVYSFAEFVHRFGFTKQDNFHNQQQDNNQQQQQAATVDEAAIRRIAEEVSKGHIQQAGAIFAQYVEQAASKVLSNEKIREAIEREADKITRPVRVEYKAANTEVKDCGVQHKAFPELLMLADVRTGDGMSLNVALVGPAGTGKTTAAKMLGKALNRPVFLYSAMDNKYEFFGYRDAHGKPVRTNAREAWEQPSIILFDEVDASSNSGVLGLNGALANGIGDFPDGNVERHPECFVLAGANTWDGATADYNGREKLDAAFRNRFVKLDWMIDESLEFTFAVNKGWCKLVQSFRREVESKGIRGVLITPRATIYGDAMLARGFNVKRTAEIVLKPGLTDAQFADLINKASMEI